MPEQGQSTLVKNPDEIARQLEKAYGMKPNSIRTTSIIINSGGTNNAKRRHRQTERKSREL
ncbi:unnamed protein product, partial [Rotaria sp. Silwood2]